MSNKIDWSAYFTFKPADHLSRADVTQLLEHLRGFSHKTHIVPSTLSEAHLALSRLPISYSPYSGRVVWRKEKDSEPYFNQQGGKLELMLHGFNEAYGKKLDERLDYKGDMAEDSPVDEAFSFEDLVDLAEGREPKVYDKKPMSKEEQLEELRVRYNSMVNTNPNDDFLRDIVDSKTRIERIKDPSYKRVRDRRS